MPGQCRTVDLNHYLAFPWRIIMDGPCYQFFCGPRLAQYQHGTICRRHLLNEPEYLLYGQTLTYHFRIVIIDLSIFLLMGYNIAYYDGDLRKDTFEQT